MKTKKLKLIPIFILIFLLAFVFSFAMGHYPIDPITLIKVLLSKVFPITKTWTTAVESVIFNIRLPRLLAASLIGGSLAVSGLVYQGLFQNPMVSPDVLGSTSGAGFGASLAILLGFSYFGTSALSFIFGLIAVFIASLISAKAKGNRILSLVLSGMVISSLFTALISLVKLVADNQTALPQITYWLMGSLASAKYSDVSFLAITTVISIVPLFFLSWQLNVLTQGDEEAKALGVNVNLVRNLSIVFATIMSAACIAVCGTIGWVGLIIPHAVRMITGYNYKLTIPSSFLIGASFLIIIDTISRTMSTVEIPLGILTAIIGAPFFLYLILKEGNNLWV